MSWPPSSREARSVTFCWIFSNVDIIDDCGLQAITKLVERYGRKQLFFSPCATTACHTEAPCLPTHMVDRIDGPFSPTIINP